MAFFSYFPKSPISSAYQGGSKFDVARVEVYDAKPFGSLNIP
jgi:hypothetical protein